MLARCVKTNRLFIRKITSYEAVFLLFRLRRSKRIIIALASFCSESKPDKNHGSLLRISGTYRSEFLSSKNQNKRAKNSYRNADCFVWRYRLKNAQSICAGKRYWRQNYNWNCKRATTSWFFYEIRTDYWWVVALTLRAKRRNALDLCCLLYLLQNLTEFTKTDKSIQMEPNA